ncbi:SAG family member [Eimeria mitis]|uniref:SAG family member n=1 Tax=Eimeria mitis TaxID=44415 RepID=U6K1I5_9EIME|nr:SAG family member [Eimeria mitis]CDJ31544.1 SAG family member [Eimeria mitis]
MAAMPALRLLTVVGASLLLFDKIDVSGSEPPQPPDTTPTATTTYDVKLGEDGACLSEINAARKKTGFNDFVVPQADAKEKRLPEQGVKDSGEYDAWVWRPVCDVLIPKEAAGKSSDVEAGKKFMSGTYAFQIVDAANLSCNDVVEKWKNAYSNFNGRDNISFVAMYNPSEDATADCRVVTCTRTVTTAPSGLPSEAEQQEEEGEEEEGAKTEETKAGSALICMTTPPSEAQQQEEEEEEEEGAKTEETKAGSALICMTTPDVLPDNSENPPFTEEQWGQIVTALEGSASAVLPSLLGLATALLGIAAAM